MAAVKEVTDEDDAEEKVQQRTIRQFRSVEKELNDREEEQQQTVLRIMEVETELKAVKRENIKLSDMSSDLKQQLSETRELLNKTTEELSGTRQHLSDVQERLTVAEQVTAATQQRALQELQESGNSEEQQLELTPQHQLTTHAGAIFIYYQLGSIASNMQLMQALVWLWQNVPECLSIRLRL